jgi:hypothetical protein
MSEQVEREGGCTWQAFSGQAEFRALLEELGCNRS